jgi:hypothetical protein
MTYLFLTGVHPTSVHLIGGCLMGVYLTCVHLLGVCIVVKASWLRRSRCTYGR